MRLFDNCKVDLDQDSLVTNKWSLIISDNRGMRLFTLPLFDDGALYKNIVSALRAERSENLIRALLDENNLNDRRFQTRLDIAEFIMKKGELEDSFSQQISRMKEEILESKRPARLRR